MVEMMDDEIVVEVVDDLIEIEILAGEKGETGAKGDPGETGPEGPQGERGPQGIPGADGVGIALIAKVGSSGLVDTYLITLTNGAGYIFEVTNGASIASIIKTGSSGLTDTYTITLTNGDTSTFEVTNGAKGEKGDTGPQGPQGPRGAGITSIEKIGSAGLVDTYRIMYSDGYSLTYTVTNGAKGDTGAQGPQGETGPQGPQGPRGVGITDIVKIGSEGLVDTYRIYYSDGYTLTYTVTNGEKGEKGDTGPEGPQGPQGPAGPRTYTVWGDIDGYIANQTDLQNALNGKADTNHAHGDLYYSKTETDTKLAGKSDTGHTHDDLYYTESEVDKLLEGKAESAHKHGNMYNDTSFPSDTAVANGDKLIIADSSANGKMARSGISFDGATTNRALTPKGTWGAFAAANHNHDSAYAAKDHNHDERYYTESEMDTALSEKAALDHGHGNLGNGGAVAGNVGIGNGDGLVVSDHSNSDKLTCTNVKFDGLDTDKALTPKGTWEPFAKQNHNHDSVYAAADHNHDGQYYTESEIDAKLSEKAASSHSHSADDISGGYLNVHPENNPTLIPFMNNDIAFLLKRGGSAVVTYDDVIKNVDISNVFDGTPSYLDIPIEGKTTVVFELTLHKAFTWANTIYVDFGLVNWRAKGIKIEVMNTNYPGDTWTQKKSTTTNGLGHYAISTSHVPVGASDAGGGFNKVRFTFSSFVHAYTFRIAQIGIYNYGSKGLSEPFVSRGGSEIFGTINPYQNNGADLGTLAKYFRNAYIRKLNGVEIGDDPKFTDTTYTFDTTPTAESQNPVTSGGIKTALDEIDVVLADLSDEIEEIINQSKYKKYGVTGIGQSGAALTRTMDAVGMIAQVGTDGDNSSVVNDFDNALPWMRRKCVGEWSLVDGKAVFTVNAYYGDNNYTEDGSMGDYVAVECPRCYYHRDIFGITITSYPYPFFRPFDIFCRDHNPADTMEKIYLPAYALAVKNGQAVSLPGLENEQGLYKSLLDTARTYKGGALGNLAILQPMEVNFYEWALFTVEFATQNSQAIMRGMTEMRSDGNTCCKFIDNTHLLVTDWAQAAQTSIAGWSANWRKPGDYLCVLAASVGDIHDMRYKATHRVISVTRCDASGAASSSGQYSLIEVEDLGKSYWSYDYTGGTDYKLGGRPYPTGACNDVSTPSGSPRSNSDGHNPFKYRWRENVYGNQFKTIVNLFGIRAGTSDDDYYLEWYYLPDPAQFSPSANDRPNASELNASPFLKLDIQTEHADYLSGYVRSKKYSDQNPDVWIPLLTSGGSGTTYFCDYAYLVYSPAVRSVRLGGSWYNGLSAGFSSFPGYSAPSFGSASFGGDLCFIQ